MTAPVIPRGFNCPHHTTSETPKGSLVLVNHGALPMQPGAYQYKLCGYCFLKAMRFAAELGGQDPELVKLLATAIAAFEALETERPS